MGFFSKPKDVEVETTAVPAEEHVEEIPSLPTPLTSTVIATGLTVSGTLEGEGVIQVEGVVKGQIVLNGAVIVTTTGSIEGPVTANVIQIAGSIHDGGRLNGRSNMVKTIDAKATAEPSAPAEELEFGPNYKAKG